MSYVQNSVLRKIQILVSHKLFDYTGDFVVAVNVLVVSVSTGLTRRPAVLKLDLHPLLRIYI